MGNAMIRRLLWTVVFFASISGARASAGEIVDAACSGCGYARPGLMLFGGKANFRTVCLYPALCLATREIALHNVMSAAPPEGCRGEWTSYADQSLGPDKPGETVASWNRPDGGGALVLRTGGYVCPRCGKKTLHFSRAGFWD